MFQPKFYCIADILLGFLSKTFEEEKAVFLTGIEKFPGGFDLHILPDGGDLFRAETFDLEHFDDTGGGVGDILVEELKFSGFDDFADFFADCVPNALYGGQFIGGDVPDGGGEFFEGKGGDRVRFCLKRVLAVDIHELAEQAELFGDIVVVDCHL